MIGHECGRAEEGDGVLSKSGCVATLLDERGESGVRRMRCVNEVWMRLLESKDVEFGVDGKLNGTVG